MSTSFTIDPSNPLSPSELVLLNGDKFAKKVMLGNVKLMHTDASVSTAQLGLAILAAAESRRDWQQVDIHMGRSIKLAKEKNALPELAVSLLRYADLLEKKGDKDRAESYWNQARDLAKQIGCQIFNRLDSEANI